MVGGAGTGEKLRKIRWTQGREALEYGLHKMEFSSGTQSGQTKFTASCRSRRVLASTKNSAASKVQQEFKVKGLSFSTSDPNNIAVVKWGRMYDVRKRSRRGQGRNQESQRSKFRLWETFLHSMSK